MALTDFLGEEVFVVTSGEEEDESPIHIYSDMYELIEFMKSFSPDTDSDTRVLHGVLTSAEILPSTLKNKSAFVIFLNPVDDKVGYVSESGSTTTKELAMEIETTIAFGDDVFGVRPTIDDVFILYGYQIETCLSIRDDDLDEEAIYTCKKISDDIDEIRESAGIPITVYGGNDE